MTVARRAMAVAALIAAAACSLSPSPGPFQTLTSAGGWRLIAMDGRPPLTETTITLFPESASLGGFGGCNSYGARVRTADDEALTVSGIESTAAACARPEATEQEGAYLRILGEVTGARLEGGRLVLDGTAGSLSYEAIPPPRGGIDDLVGAVWRVVEPAPPEPDRFTFALPGHGVAFGRAGCRAWVADYRSRVSRVAFPSTSMAGEPCDDTAADEGGFTDALTWARDVVVGEDGWTLRTIRGDGVAFGPLEPASVQGRWSLLAMRVEAGPLQEPGPPPVPTLTVGPGTVQGDAGCNTFGGDWSGDRQRPALGELFRTERLCTGEGVMEREEAYLRLLSSGRVMLAAGDLLWIGRPDGAGLLFERRD